MNTKDTFLSLLRLGIGHDGGCIPEIVDWSGIVALAERQGLSAIVMDGVSALNDKGVLTDGRTMSHILKAQWIGSVIQNYESRYSSYKKTIAELADFYRSHGINMMVLKGIGLSFYYPIPNHRPCGDIDIWNFGKQKEADEILNRELGLEVDNSHHQHTVFYFRGFMIENHYDFVTEYASKTNALLVPILKKLAEHGYNEQLVDSVPVYFPSADFNSLFLLRHMLMHFVAVGISFRLLLDWGFFWKAEHKNVNKDYVLGIVNKFGMADFFHIINRICVEDLGFNRDIFPETQSAKGALKDKVLDDIFNPDYDKDEAHQKGFLRRVTFKLKRWQGNRWKRELCFNESQLTSLMWSVRSHILKPASI